MTLTSNQDHQRKWTPATCLALGAIVVGLALRVYAAFALPLDQDELYTLAESRDLFHTALAPGIDSRPLYYLVQHPLLSISASPIGLRVLPMIFGALGLWVTWLLGRRYFDQWGGAMTVIIAAFSPWHLYASSMARYYSLVYLCAALVILWLSDAYETDRPASFLSALAAFLVGTLTHPSFVIGIAGAVLGLTLMRRDGRLGWRWPSRNAWAYLWAPYAAALVIEFIILRVFGRRSALANLGTRGLAASIRLIPAMIDWMTISVFVAATVGALILAFSRRRERVIGVMAIAATAVTFALLFVASTRTGVYADYGIGILPLIFLCVIGLTRGPADETMISVRSWGMLAVVLGASAPSLVSFLSDGLRFDYRPAYAAIAARDPNAVVLGWPEALRRQYGGQLRGYELRPDSAYLDGILAKERDVWAVVSIKRYGIVEDDGGVMARWLSVHCRLEHSYSHPRFDYRLYRVDLYRCESSLTPVVKSANAQH